MPVGAPDTGLAYYSSVLEQNDNQVVARVDNNFGDKLRIYGRYLYDNLEQPSTSISTNILTAVPSKSWTSQNFALNAAYIFSPNLVATATATYNRVLNIQIGPPDFPSLTSLGANIPNLTKGSKNGVDLSISGYFSTFWDGLYRIPRDEYDINTNWSWTSGKHTIEFGRRAGGKQGGPQARVAEKGIGVRMTIAVAEIGADVGPRPVKVRRCVRRRCFGRRFCPCCLHHANHHPGSDCSDAWTCPAECSARDQMDIHGGRSLRSTALLSPQRKTAPCARTARRKDDSAQAGLLACGS